MMPYCSPVVSAKHPQTDVVHSPQSPALVGCDFLSCSCLPLQSLLVAPRNLAPQVGTWRKALRARLLIGFLCHSVASCSAARQRRHSRMRFARSGSALPGRGEESRTAPSKKTKRIKYEHDRKSHPNRTQPGASTAGEPTRQTFKVSSPATGVENRIFA